MPPQLSHHQQGTLNQASRKELKQAFQMLQPYLQQNNWLDPSNRYRNNCVQSLESDLPNSISGTDLSQYVAASAVLHCADGWSFLGRALACHACGDSDVARHLGYFAELRATMSILASEGIGVFNKDHCVIDATNHQKFVRGWNTHMMAWLALKAWAQRTDSADILADVIRPNHLPLRQWLDAFGAGTQLRPLGETWLTSWGLDLQRMSDDRMTRNEASYRPTRLNGARSLTGSESSRLMCDLWLQCQPGFESLDNHLLRLSLEEAYFMMTNKKPSGDMVDYGNRLSGMLSRMNVAAVWKTFLTRGADPSNPIILDEAKKQDPITHPSQHGQVISRAALLLRIATGISSGLLRGSGFNKGDLEFWWRDFGEDRGLWDHSSTIGDFGDLWTEIEDSIDSATQWNQTPNNVKSIRSWLDDESKVAWSLTGCERIALWGLF
jgi:hypothetical protein